MLRIHPYIIPFFHCQNAQRIVSFYKTLYIADVYEFDFRPLPDISEMHSKLSCVAKCVSYLKGQMFSFVSSISSPMMLIGVI